jgi:hydroxymethylpyrimidine pyrophosphatase-like HAD family hydrolase
VKTRYLALATDYDGTLATHGKVDEQTLEALRRCRAAGVKLILVSGRELESLQRTFARFDMFDLMVLENGALLYEPSTKRERPLCDPPPAQLIDLLHARGVRPVSVGRVIVATFEPHETTVLEAIHTLGLEHQVIFNKGAVMVLPAGVNKATGLKIALEEMRIDPSNTVAVGDAENDHALLELCGVGAAVANALESLKEHADVVLLRDHGAGVSELIDRMLAGDLEPSPLKHAPKPDVRELGDHVEVVPNA